jgi:nicotinamide N-methyltransferase
MSVSIAVASATLVDIMRTKDFHLNLSLITRLISRDLFEIIISCSSHSVSPAIYHYPDTLLIFIQSFILIPFHQTSDHLNLTHLTMSTSDHDDDTGGLDLFAEPADYYPPSPVPTTASHTLLNGHTITVRLVGHNPLWGHHLWQAGRIISSYFEKSPALVANKTVLELGAGAGLPSLVCGILGARKVVVSDYPDQSLIENLVWNIEHLDVPVASTEEKKGNEKEKWVETVRSRIAAEGYLWGADPAPLLAYLPKESNGESTDGFDVLILADLLFNHSEHGKLVSTMKQTLSKRDGAKAFVFFSPYRPWLLEKDLAFFDLAREEGFVVDKVLEEKMEKVMFQEDRGDEEIRRTVFGYVLVWNQGAEA